MLIFDHAKSSSTIKKNAINLVGIPFEGTVTYRGGTKDAPNAIRKASDQVEFYSPYFDYETTDLMIYDLGDVAVADTPEEIYQNFYRLLDGFSLKHDNIKIISMGGDHSISFAPITKYLEEYRDLVVVHLDAHSDLRDGYLGVHYSHAAIMKRIVEKFGPNHRLMQFGIRSGTKEEFLWMKENKTLYYGLELFLAGLEKLSANTPIYLSLDVDFFDPAIISGTGTPEPGGESFSTFLSILKRLSYKNLVGADVVELSPLIDPTNNSTVVVTTIIREIALALGKGKVG